MTVPSLSLTDTALTKLHTDAVVVGIHPDDSADSGVKLSTAAQQADKALGGGLAGVLHRLGAKGSVGEVTKVATWGKLGSPLLVAVGLGGQDSEDRNVVAERVRKAAGAAVRSLADNATVAIAFDGATQDASVLAAIGHGAVLGSYTFTRFKTDTSKLRTPVTSVEVVVDKARDKDNKETLTTAVAVAHAVANARDWVNTPANHLRPPEFAEQVAAAAAAAGLKTELLEAAALRKGGYGGILAVGQGSEAEPRLVRLSYSVRGAKKSVALVGKGITFDTGGISLKAANGMQDMKTDMGGAAAVAATMLAVAAVKPKVNVVAYLPMAENMPSGSAYRPSDVITMYNGTTAEVLNTDAEGRMVLADGIARACEDNPDYLMETSTLTGGQVTALGMRFAGVMGTEEFTDRVKLAGQRTGEPMWPMPLPEEIISSMESDIADHLQISAGFNRAGHMLQGGNFVSHFVTDGLPWAHIDIAGPSTSDSATGYFSKGATGVPARTMLSVIEDIAANG